MFFGTYIFAEKHMFFVRPLLEHDVYEKVPCKKHIFFVRPLLEHDVYEKVPCKKHIFFVRPLLVHRSRWRLNF